MAKTMAKRQWQKDKDKQQPMKIEYHQYNFPGTF